MKTFQHLKAGPGRNSADVLELSLTRDQINNSFIVGNMENNMHYVYSSPLEFSHVLDSIEFSKRVFEEVIYGHLPQKIKIDLDIPQSKLDNLLAEMKNDEFVNPTIDTVIDIIVETLIDEFYAMYSSYFIEHGHDLEKLSIKKDDILIATSSGQDANKEYKESYHIIFACRKFAVNNNTDARLITKNLLEALPEYIKNSRIIDDGVNKSLQKFRLTGCHKPNSNRTKVIVNKFNWYDSVIGVYDNRDIEILPPLLTDGSVEQSKKELMHEEYYDAAIQMAEPYTKDFEFRNCAGNIINYNRIRPSHCIFCNKIHENDNTLFVEIATVGNVFLICRRSPTNKQNIGVLNIQTDVKKIKRSLEYAYEKVMAGKVANTEVLWANHEPSIRYSENKMRPYGLYRTNVIHANMGLGKTTELVNCILDNFNFVGSRILVISFRQTFTSSIDRGKLKQFDFKVYNEIKNSKILKENRLIVQVESLHRVDLSTPYDLVILDECESIIGQFGSGLFKNQIAKVLGKFASIMKNSEYIILMDANISDRTYNSLKYFRPNHEIFYHRNSFKNATSDTWYITDDKGVWLTEIKNAISKGERVFIPTNSLEVANAVHRTIKGMFSKKICIIYTSKTDKDIRKLHFSNVDEYWSTADYLIITPTCTAGVSFEKKYYDKVFPYFTDQSCDVETCRQMVARVRDIKTREYYAFFECKRSSLPTNTEQIRKYICSTQRVLDNSVDTVCLESLFDLHYNEFDQATIKTNTALVLYLENKRIENLSKNYFASRFMYQLTETGASIKLMENNDPDASVELNLALKRNKREIAEEDCKKIADAVELTDFEAENMKSLKEAAADEGGDLELSEEDELALQKHYLRRYYNYRDLMSIKFVKIYNNQKTKELFHTLKQVRNFHECTSRDGFLNTLERIRLMEIGKNQLTIDDDGEQLNIQSGRSFSRHRFCFALILSMGFNSFRDNVDQTQLFDNFKKYESHIRLNSELINMSFNVLPIVPIQSDPKYNELFLSLINKILSIQYDIKIDLIDQKISYTPRYKLTKSSLFEIKELDNSAKEIIDEPTNEGLNLYKKAIHNINQIEPKKIKKEKDTVPLITWSATPTVNQVMFDNIENLYIVKKIIPTK
jgi:hypothetical protein